MTKQLGQLLVSRPGSPSRYRLMFVFSVAAMVSMTCYHCTSLPFLPTQQASCYQNTCKAGFQARGQRLPG